MRSTFRNFRLSRAGSDPSVLGLCQSDIPGLLAYANEAQQRLINVGGETGWWGGWAKVVFVISRNYPYITLGRYYARAINLDVCRFPIRIQNEFYEELDAGIGLRIPGTISDWCGPFEGYERGTVSTMFDITPQNQYLRAYPANSGDSGKSVIFNGAIDQNGNPIYTQVGNVSINGAVLTFGTPAVMVQTPYIVTGFSAVTKDVTLGDVTITQLDATSATEVTLSRYAADETNPAYRRYYINDLPCSCCGPTNTPVTPGPVTITAMCKYEFIPALRDSDPLIIGNIPALVEESQAIRYSSMDSPNGSAQEGKHHARAVKILQDEMRHYLGADMPAVNFAPFGTARLERAGIGLVI